MYINFEECFQNTEVKHTACVLLNLFRYFYIDYNPDFVNQLLFYHLNTAMK